MLRILDTYWLTLISLADTGADRHVHVPADATHDLRHEVKVCTRFEGNAR
jgi:hypothetical protein